MSPVTSPAVALPAGISLPSGIPLSPRFLKDAIRRKKKEGWSMIELMVVIGIMAFGMIAVFIVVPQAYNSYKAANESSYYATMSSDTRTVFATQGDFTGITPNVLIDLGLVPSTLVNGTTIRSSFNTPIGVAATNLNGTAGDGVEFTYTLPREVCTKFVQKAAMASTRVLVDSVSVLDRTTGDNTVNAIALAGACNSTSGGNITVALAVAR